MARICGICPVSHLIASAKAVRRHPGRRAAADRRGPAADHQPGPDRPVERAVASSTSRRRTCCSASTRIRPCATSSAWPAQNPQLARDGIGAAQVGPADHRVAGRQAHPPGVDRARAAWPRRSPRRSATGSSPAFPEAIAAVERAIAWYKTRHAPLGGRGRHVRQLPLGVHGPRRPPRQRRPLRRLAAGHRRRRQAPGRPRRPASSSTTTSARPSSPGRTSSRPTGRRWATRTASTGSGRWRGSTWPTRWARRAPTRSSRSSAGASAAWPARPSTTTTRASSTRSTAIEKIEELLRGPDILSHARAVRRGHQPQRGHRRLRGAARHAACTTTRWTTTASSSGRTWSSPPATTTWP